MCVRDTSSSVSKLYVESPGPNRLTPRASAPAPRRQRTMIELTTLGRGSIRRNGSELESLATHRQKFALLVYLAMEGPVARDRLLAMFWPERNQEKARHSLSQALYALRRELHEECVQMSGDLVQASGTRCSLDARALEAAAEDERWDAVIELYHGPFLDQFSLPAAPDFEEWASRTRTHLARLARRAFQAVVEANLAVGDLATALATAARWAVLEPLEDEAQHTYIALLARAGDRTAALQHYNTYRDRLAAELEVEPLEATATLVERIRAGETPEFTPLAAEASPPPPAAVEAEAAIDEEGSASPPWIAAADGEAPAPARGWGALLGRLRSRRVVQVGLVYLGAAWLALQLTATLTEQEVLPTFVFPLLLFFLGVGLPFALILAWAQEHPIDEATGAELGDETLPTWMRRVRPGQILAALSTAVFFLLVGYTLLRPSAGEKEPVASAPGALDPTRIAVLYFDDHSREQELGPLAAGLTNDLIYELSQVSALSVVPLHGVKPYRDTRVPLDSIARALAAGTLVEGSLNRSGDMLAVTVRLIDGQNISQLDSRLFTQQWGDFVAMSHQLAREVSDILRNTLGVEIELRRRREATESDKAWELVSRAEEAMDEARRFRIANSPEAADRVLGRAGELLEQAAAADPRWIEPIVMHGWAAFYRARLGQATPQTYDVAAIREGIALAERALTLERQDPSALELRGALHLNLYLATDSTGALESAESDLRAAALAEPPRARARSWLAELLRLKGQLGEAAVWARRALDADPFLRFDDQTLFYFSQTLMDVGEFKEASAFCEEGRRRFPNEAAYSLCLLVALASAEGPPPEVERAWQLVTDFERELGAPTGVPPYGHFLTAAVLIRADLKDSARAVLSRARAATEDDPGLWTLYYEANTRLLMGEKQATIELLARFLEVKPDRRVYIAQESWWRPLHGDPAFDALVSENPPSR